MTHHRANETANMSRAVRRSGPSEAAKLLDLSAVPPLRYTNGTTFGLRMYHQGAFAFLHEDSRVGKRRTLVLAGVRDSP